MIVLELKTNGDTSIISAIDVTIEGNTLLTYQTQAETHQVHITQWSKSPRDGYYLIKAQVKQCTK